MYTIQPYVHIRFSNPQWSEKGYVRHLIYEKIETKKDTKIVNRSFGRESVGNSFTTRVALKRRD